MNIFKVFFIFGLFLLLSCQEEMSSTNSSDVKSDNQVNFFLIGADGQKKKYSFDLKDGKKISKSQLEELKQKFIDPNLKKGSSFVGWRKNVDRISKENNSFNTFKDLEDFSYDLLKDGEFYATFNTPPIVNEGVEWTNLTIPWDDVAKIFTWSYYSVYLSNVFADSDGDKLTYKIISAFKNGENVDKKSIFFIGNGTDRLLTSGKKSDKGFYRLGVEATDPFGAKVEHYISAILFDAWDKPNFTDASKITHSVTVRKVGFYSNYIKTGSGDDFFFYRLIRNQTEGMLLDLGSGNDKYRFNRYQQKNYIYSFGSGDKILLKKDHFNNFAFSSYETRNNVVATGISRIIYITGTGEFYRDENGDAVFKASDGTLDLKEGADDKKMANLYSNGYVPGNTGSDTPATFGEDNFEILDFLNF